MPGTPPPAFLKTPASSPKEQWRAWVFRAYLAAAVVAFVALAISASFHSYFSFDLVITRSLQTIQSPSLFAFMWAISAVGYAPQTFVISAALILFIWLLGLRWGAVVAAFAALGSSGLGQLIKLWVHRPRPAPGLVLVFRQLDSYSFPSGHVLFYTAFFGFLLFLAYTLLKPPFIRGLTIVLLASLIVLIGPSRIYLGGHWASDVVGGYLFGSLWLTLSIYIYRWGKPRFFAPRLHSPY